MVFPPNRAFNRENKRRLFSVARDNSHSDFLSSISPTNPGAVLLDPCYGSHNLNPPVWCKLCHQSGSPISPLWGRHLLFPKRPSLDIPPHLICCRPGEWGDLRICSYIISLSLWSVWPHFTLCYDVRWWSPCSFSWFSEARKRAQVNHRTFGVWGGVNIVTCTQKSQKSVADSTVPVNLVPCMFIP